MQSPFRAKTDSNIPVANENFRSVMHPLTLKFKFSNLEKEFIKNFYIEASEGILRHSLALLFLTAFFYIIFFWFYREIATQPAVVICLLAIATTLTITLFGKQLLKKPRLVDFLTPLHILLFHFCVLYIQFQMGPAEIQVGFVLTILFLISTYFITRLRFDLLVISCLLVTAMWVAVYLYFGHYPSLKGKPWMMIFCFLVSNVVGITVAYNMERSFRLQFLLKNELMAEQNISEKLLLNILPYKIAMRLKDDEANIADLHANVSVLFADIVGFTDIAGELSAKQLVDLLNDLFSKFDDLVEKHKIEKIKTIGDAYMAVAGLPEACEDHAKRIAAAALDFLDVVQDYNTANKTKLQLRIGINSGTVVAGVIGKKKFIYDLWGDTVNVASRMESTGEANEIQVTHATFLLLKDKYHFLSKGSIDVKGKGPMKTYILINNA